MVNLIYLKQLKRTKTHKNSEKRVNMNYICLIFDLVLIANANNCLHFARLTFFCHLNLSGAPYYIA